MIQEDYVSFEIAKLLKEKGFEGQCSVEQVCTEISHNEDSEWTTEREVTVGIPTLQMAMKWLREVHHCVICITPLTFYCGEIVSKWGYCIWADDNTEIDEESSPRLESYEDACESAIKYCLENLI